VPIVAASANTFVLPLSYIPFFSEMKKDLYPLFLYDGGLTIEIQLSSAAQCLSRVVSDPSHAAGVPGDVTGHTYSLSNLRLEAELITLHDEERNVLLNKSLNSGVVLPHINMLSYRQNTTGNSRIV
jgi:hypothetical protein